MLRGGFTGSILRRPPISTKAAFSGFLRSSVCCGVLEAYCRMWMWWANPARGNGNAMLNGEARLAWMLETANEQLLGNVRVVIAFEGGEVRLCRRACLGDGDGDINYGLRKSLSVIGR